MALPSGSLPMGTCTYAMTYRSLQGYYSVSTFFQAIALLGFVLPGQLAVARHTIERTLVRG